MAQLVKATTKQGQGIIHDLHTRYGHDDIWDAYTRPSAAKVRAWRQIEATATTTPGYNHDLQIVGASSHFFSTVYSYTDADGQHIIKDTHANTYEVII